MEGSRCRSSTALLLLALMVVAASSTTAAMAAAAQRRRQPPADGSYKLISVGTYPGKRFRLAVRADDSYVAGFANGKNQWFAIQGMEDILEAFRGRFSGGDIPDHTLVNLLGALVKRN